jgi:hypothetical protein
MTSEDPINQLPIRTQSPVTQTRHNTTDALHEGQNEVYQARKKITWYKNIGILNIVVDNVYIWYSLYLKYCNVVNI